jgi:hypothetical protein
LAPISSKPLAIQMVQVMMEAMARPIITIFTMMSAFWYMPHGDRSWAMPKVLSASSTSGRLPGGVYCLRDRWRPARLQWCVLFGGGWSGWRCVSESGGRCQHQAEQQGRHGAPGARSIGWRSGV